MDNKDEYSNDDYSSESEQEDAGRSEIRQESPTASNFVKII